MSVMSGPEEVSSALGELHNLELVSADLVARVALMRAAVVAMNRAERTGDCGLAHEALLRAERATDGGWRPASDVEEMLGDLAETLARVQERIRG